MSVPSSVASGNRPSARCPTPQPRRAPTRTLIVEDDFSSRFVLQKLLARLGKCDECDVATNGAEGILAFQTALDAGRPYDLMFLDIMLPEFDGHAVLREIRLQESRRGIFSSDGCKIVMTTALRNMKHVMAAYRGLCDGYVAKPIKCAKLHAVLKELKVPEFVPG